MDIFLVIRSVCKFNVNWLSSCSPRNFVCDIASNLLLVISCDCRLFLVASPIEESLCMVVNVEIYRI